MTTKPYLIYTDGAHKNSWGSWAFIVIKNNQVIYEASSRCRDTNSLRMEIQAVIEAIKYLKDQPEFIIHTDCRILIDNVKLLDFWKSWGWKKQNQAPIPNGDLYQKLYQLVKNKNIEWKWVKAHSEKNFYNERCDELCRVARGI